MKGRRREIGFIISYQVLLVFAVVFFRHKDMPRFYAPTFDEWEAVMANAAEYTAGVPEIIVELAVAAKWCFALFAIALIGVHISKLQKTKKDIVVQVAVLLIGLIMFAVYVVWNKTFVGMEYMYYMNFIPVEILMIVLALELINEKARKSAA